MTTSKKSTIKAWTPEDDAVLGRTYLTHTHQEIADMIGRTRNSVRSRCSDLGLLKKPLLTEEEQRVIRAWYTEHRDTPLGDFDISGLVQQLNRPASTIFGFASREGLTNNHRGNSQSRREHISETNRQWHADNEHPRGMLGKKHRPELFTVFSENGKYQWHRLTPLEQAIQVAKALQTKIKRYGTGNPAMMGKNPYSRTKSGKREDLNNQFFRSSWEANYARYLNFLIVQGVIESWEYEKKTFRFEGIRQGTMTYTPDFKVVYPDGSYEWHEVKGWMDDKSRIKLKRMAKYYPDETVVLIDQDQYKAISKWKRLIEGWEEPKK